ncbi:hypothetical protein ACO0QE_002279 [Hanseniaspora vineae]
MFMSKKFLLAGAAVLAAFNNVQAQQEAVAPENSDVVKLSSETFDSFIKTNSLVLAEFFAPWCGHCKTLGPHYVEAASVLKEFEIPLVQVDCTENQDLCMEQGIKGYPSLKVIRNGDALGASDYTGGRTASDIITYMKKQSLPAVSVFNTEKDLEAFVAKEQDVSPVVINYDISEPNVNATFYYIADLLRDEDYIFAALQNSSVAQDKSAISIQVPNQDPVNFDYSTLNVTNTTSVLNSLGDWLSVESKPYFGDVNAATYEPYMNAEIPLAYFFYTSDKERAKYAPFFEKLGKEYRGVMNFAGLDASKFGRHAENLNMKQQFPFFSIHNISSDLKYGTAQLPDEKFVEGETKIKISEKAIAQFVEKFLDGKLEPIIKSEEIPEVQETNVTKIVGKNHDDFRYDEDKDVLIKYYAPWCGHCKRLVPIFENLADVYAGDEEAQSKIVIGEIDATLNDVFDVDIQGFPTIVFYPAGSKNETPVVYSGPRTVESFISFITTNGKTGVDGMKILEAQMLAEQQERLAELEHLDAEDELEDDDEIEHDEL